MLALVNGEYVIVESVQHEILERPLEVYNFQVEDYHTYYVSDSSVLVHNRCGDSTKITNKEAREAAKELGYKEITGNQHSHGELIFENKKAPNYLRYISPDNTSHNGGFWKAAKSIDTLLNRTVRTGTYTRNLKYLVK